MVNLIDLLHQKIELFRLEQRYTRRRHRRSTFVSEAQYVDGEYIYANTSAKHNTGGSSDSDETVASPTSPNSARKDVGPVSGGKGTGSKRLSRLGMGMDWRKGKNAGGEGGQRASVMDVRWDGSGRN